MVRRAKLQQGTEQKFGNIFWSTTCRLRNITINLYYSGNTHVNYIQKSDNRTLQTLIRPWWYSMWLCSVMVFLFHFLTNIIPKQFKIVDRINNPSLNGEIIYKHILIKLQIKVPQVRTISFIINSQLMNQKW